VANPAGCTVPQLKAAAKLMRLKLSGTKVCVCVGVRVCVCVRRLLACVCQSSMLHNACRRQTPCGVHTGPVPHVHRLSWRCA
jgi:hypothetical protein